MGKVIVEALIGTVIAFIGAVLTYFIGNGVFDQHYEFLSTFGWWFLACVCGVVAIEGDFI